MKTRTGYSRGSGWRSPDLVFPWLLALPLLRRAEYLLPLCEIMREYFNKPAKDHWALFLPNMAGTEFYSLFSSIIY